jgi:hypothetical protein
MSVFSSPCGGSETSLALSRLHSSPRRLPGLLVAGPRLARREEPRSLAGLTPVTEIEPVLGRVLHLPGLSRLSRHPGGLATEPLIRNRHSLLGSDLKPTFQLGSEDLGISPAKGLSPRSGELK